MLWCCILVYISSHYAYVYVLLHVIYVTLYAECNFVVTQIQDVVPITSYDTTGSLLLLGCENGSIYNIGMFLYSKGKVSLDKLR